MLKDWQKQLIDEEWTEAANQYSNDREPYFRWLENGLKSGKFALFGDEEAGVLIIVSEIAPHKATFHIHSRTKDSGVLLGMFEKIKSYALGGGMKYVRYEVRTPFRTLRELLVQIGFQVEGEHPLSVMINGTLRTETSLAYLVEGV